MIKAIKGTKDIFQPEIFNWNVLENLILETFLNYNYSEIRTPIFEETALFARSIGEATDIVGKEMYTFTDKGGTSLTLKPEMTASVMRAVLEHSLHKKQPLNKFFYISPMFRQERPQAGRLRQFHQFGAEAIGSNDPYLDAEMIMLPYIILASLGLTNFKIKINTLGSPKEREQYKLVLRNYLQPKLNDLSEESRKRFETNILRIFDSKDARDIEIMKDAPKIEDYISEADREHFEKVLAVLAVSQLDFEIDHTLVRGLDYYTHTTFEIVSDSVGAQSALCGGGRYNLLSSQLGGPEIPAVGFAAGMERILLAVKNENITLADKNFIDTYVVVTDKEMKNSAYSFTTYLRMEGIRTDMDFLGRSVKAQMREANRLNARYVLFIGEELSENKVILKNMETGEQTEFDLQEELEELIDEIILGDLSDEDIEDEDFPFDDPSLN